MPYDFRSGEVREVPSYFLEYRGTEQQLVVGLAFGQDGLYFVPLLPNSDGSSAVIRVSYDPEAPHPYVVGRGVGAAALMQEKGCFSCHELDGQGGTAGPSLDQLGLLKRLQYRLNSPAWVASVQKLQGEEFEDERREVLDAEGRDRIRLWVKNQILSPGFDNPSSQMPDLGLSEDEADEITAYLVGEDESGSRGSRASRRGCSARACRLARVPEPASSSGSSWWAPHSSSSWWPRDCSGGAGRRRTPARG